MARVSQKSPEAFRTIAEVAEILGVSAPVLRYWEAKIPALRPTRLGNRRYYRPADILLLTEIKRHVTVEGVQVSEVAKLLPTQRSRKSG